MNKKSTTMNLIFRSMIGACKKVPISFHFWILAITFTAITITYYYWFERFPWFWPYFIFEFNNKIIGLPFIIPFIYVSIFVSWRFGLAVWILILGAVLPLLFRYHPTNHTALIFNIMFLLVPLSVLLLIVSQLNWRAKQRRIAIEREKERKIYTARIFQAYEDERKRIAQELHDGAIQELVVLTNSAQLIVSNAEMRDFDQIHSQALWLRDRIVQLKEEIRRISRDLRPSILDDIGLVPALRWLINSLRKETDLDARLLVKGEIKKLNPQTEVTIFRIIQEALNNVRKHSNGKSVLVTLEFTPDLLKMTITDDGKGFLINEVLPYSVTEGKMGIIGMEQRANSIGATFRIESNIGEGTIIAMELNHRAK